MKKSLYNLCILAFVLSLALLSGCNGYEQQEALFDEAERLLGSGDYGGALAKYTELVDTFPGSDLAPASQYRIGYIHSHHFNDKEAAGAAYSMLLRLYAESPEVTLAREDMASIYSSSGEHRKAIVEYVWLLENGDEDKRDMVRYKIAEEYISLNDFIQARVELKELIREIPETPLMPEARYLMAATYYLEGSYDEAIAEYDRFVANYPDHRLSLDAKLAKATALDESGRLKDALSLLSQLKLEYVDDEVVKLRIESAEERLKEGPGVIKRRVNL